MDSNDKMYGLTEKIRRHTFMHIFTLTFLASLIAINAVIFHNIYQHISEVSGDCPI